MWQKFGFVGNFFPNLRKLAKQRVPWNCRSPPPPELPTSSELELGSVDVDTGTREQPIIIDQQPHRATTVDHVRTQWPLAVIGVCITAVGAALQALQAPKPLPVIFHYFCMVLELSFAALMVSIYIHRRFKVTSVVMEHVSIFLGATAFMLVIGMNFTTPFMEITVAVYFTALLVVIIANSFMP